MGNKPPVGYGRRQLHGTYQTLSFSRPILDYFRQVKLPFVYLLLLLVGCATQPNDVIVVWDNDRAIAVRIRHNLIGSPLVPDSLKVRISTETESVLGTSEEEDGRIVFTPVVPFTGGLSYLIRYGHHDIATFNVPFDTTYSDPELLGIYPSSDTVPENLLKMYFTFSEPMMEGKSASQVFVIRNETDTLRNVFLDLTPELWNAESTVLTLWIDPGRVKRDLIPNKMLGKPIEQSSNYKVVVERHWRSQQGARTKKDYLKLVHVGKRDDEMPSVDKWRIRAPKSETFDTLYVEFNESIDFKLMTDAIHVIDSERRLLDCVKLPGRHEKMLLIVPITNWKQGIYSLMVEPRLEDLAGNNLTRLFDRDLLQEPGEPGDVGSREISFSIN